MSKVLNLEEIDLSCQSLAGKKLLILTDFINATYYLGFYYPLCTLADSFKLDWLALPQQEIKEKAKWQKPKLFCQTLLENYNPDLVIFNRYGLPYGSFWLYLCRDKGIPTVYFIDDDLLNIPLTFSKDIQRYQGTKELVEERHHLLSNVNLIYTSTKYLAKKLSECFPEQTIVFGSYPPYLEGLIQKVAKPAHHQDKQKFTFGYMASRGHQQDLEMILPAIAKILGNYPHTKFEVFGTISLPTQLTKFKNQVKSHPVVPYNCFLQNLYELNWDWGLAPLQDTEFNRCKSPVKYLEYTACDIPVIASDSVVYNRLLNQENSIIAEAESWYESMELVINEPQKRLSFLPNAKSLCSDKFGLGKYRQDLLKVLQLSFTEQQIQELCSSNDDRQLQTKLSEILMSKEDWQCVSSILKQENLDLKSRVPSQANIFYLLKQVARTVKAKITNKLQSFK